MPPNLTFPDEIVEVVARAIWTAEPYHDEKVTWDQLDAIYEREFSVGASTKDDVRRMARAALSALALYIAQREAAALERAADLIGKHDAYLANAIRTMKQKNPDDAGREG